MAATSTRHSDIYHARLVKVIDPSSGPELSPYNRQTGTKLVPKGSVQKMCNNNNNLTTAGTEKPKKAQTENTSSYNGDISPPVPPRGGKSVKFCLKDNNSSSSVKSARERLNVRTDCNKNFVNGQSDQSVSSGQFPKSSEISSVLRRSCETPPPKLPPRSRPVSYPYRTDGQSQISVKRGENSMPNSDSGETTSSTPEPQPLTRLNVTRHDKIWTNEKEERDPNDALSPPLNHITPESTEELWEKFDPLDVLDSASDHSDSSADTMIMMTTEEEEQNKEKITQSMQQFVTQKGQSYPNHVQIDINNVKSEPVSDNGVTKSPISQLSPKSEDTDDGYGTNSSQGTTFSSLLSSSLNSLVISDLENSSNQGSLKRLVNTTSDVQENSAISNSARTTWAVRRRAKMAENAETNSSLQEKLRELAIIEEEENTHSSIRHGSGSGQTRSAMVKHRSRGRNKEDKVSQENQDDNELSASMASDLKKFEGDLYDKLTDMDRNYRNYYGFDKESEEKKDNSKVLYFQQKVMKQSYGNDNYYNPKAYIEAQKSGKDRIDLDMSLPNLSQGSLPRHFAMARDYSGFESSSYRSNASSGFGTVDEQFSQISNFTSDGPFNHNQQVDMPSMPSKGAFMSVDNIHQNGRRALFASSADIHKLFQSRDNIGDQLQRPASCRHSFHAMPCTQQWIVDASRNEASVDVPRQRAASTSATMKAKSSWNPFGNMFSRKKNKKDQTSGSNASSGQNSKSSDPKTTQNGPQVLQSRKPIIKSHANPSATGLKRDSSMRRLAEKAGLSNLPSNGISEMPFRTITLVEPSGTKLSTLV